MRILLVHNYYQYRGGEDIVFENERDLLLSKGHEVFTFTKSNKEIKNYGLADKLGLAINTVYNSKIKNELLKLAKTRKPEIVHFHNIFPLISPAAYSVFCNMDIPVVQTVHNYRLFCANALFYRKNKVCEICSSKIILLSGIRKACYRNSRMQTSVVVLSLLVHRFLKTWKKKINSYIALNEFSKIKLIENGIAAGKIFIKPNFVNRAVSIDKNSGAYAIFVGRLSEEKGIIFLLQSWKHFKGLPLKIVGDGPLLDQAKIFVNKFKLEEVELLGYRNHDESMSLIKKAKFLVVPSQWYEVFSRVIIEAFSCGVPVIASRLGGIPDVVDHGRTGLLFDPLDEKDFIKNIEWALKNERDVQEMGKRARKVYEEKYTPEINYKLLMQIYKRAIEKSIKN